MLRLPPQFRLIQLLTDKTRIAISQSDRTPFVSSTNMIEVIGTQFEFGMSGGALLTAQDKKILGMISHQKLVIIPGQSTSFETSTQQKENHGLVIPSSQITAWIQKTLNGSSSIYTQSSNQSILGAGILFREIKQLPILLASSKLM